ncbi:MAG: CBS domain-containing protein [Gemmataceae bacterium]
MSADLKTTMVLTAGTAREIMTPVVISLRDDATVQEALILFSEKSFSAAPVIDDSGRPIGVLSQSDIIIHDRSKGNTIPEIPEFFSRSQLRTPDGEPLLGFQVEQADWCQVSDIMTPAVFSVRVDASCVEVVEQLLELDVHRLFVVDHEDTLVGVISVMDILRHLQHSPD